MAAVGNRRSVTHLLLLQGLQLLLLPQRQLQVPPPQLLLTLPLALRGRSLLGLLQGRAL